MSIDHENEVLREELREVVDKNYFDIYYGGNLVLDGTFSIEQLRNIVAILNKYDK